MKYLKLNVLKMNPKDNRATTVDAFIPELKTLFYGPEKSFYYDNLFYPNDLFFDFLAVDDTAFLRRRQKVTIMDIMRWEGSFLHRYSYPISPKLKLVLEQSNLPPHRFYGAKLRQKGEYKDYFVIQFLENTYKDVIDYSKSSFCLYDCINKIVNNECYTFSNSDDFEEKMKEIESNWLKEYEIRGVGNMLLVPRILKINKMVIKQEFNDIDIFFQPDLRWIVSERLQKRLIEEGITGVEMREITDIEIIVEE